jgi:flavin reductase (DIM6/NTAB) family NADH-FMN oxidoreductase RutF
MSVISREHINKMNKRYRVQLINSLTGYKSANLVGTANTDTDTGVKNLNLAILSSCTHVGSDPPLLSFNFRPDKTPRQTFENIMSTGCFTINHVHKNFYEKAHLTSAKYPKNVSEFTEVGLEETFLENFYAPFVKNAEVQIAMKLIEHHHIKANGTEIVIGEVIFIKCADDLIQEDGSLNYEQLGTVALAGLDTYFTTTKLSKLPYAHAPAAGRKVPASPT